MKTLVLGGSAFVGRHLVTALLAAGHEVTVLNRGITPTELPPEVRRLTVDRKDHEALRRVLDDFRVDAVLDTSAFQPEDVQPIIDIFRGRIAHYVFISSAAVYARTGELPDDEQTPRKGGSGGTYSTGKVEAEDMLMRAHGDLGFPATVLRPALIYGPHNNRPNREFAFFLRLREGRRIMVPGNGSGLLQAGHVDDLAAASVAGLGNSRAAGQAYNITGAKAVTWRYYVETLARVVGVEPNILYVPIERMTGLRTDAPWPYPSQFSSAYDIHKAVTDLDWKPRYSFEEGHRQTYAWFVESGLADTMTWDWDAENRLLTAIVGG